MNKLQKFRHQMAEMGFEYTIDETKDLVSIAKGMLRLSKLSDEELKSRCDFNEAGHMALYEAVMELKKRRSK